MVVRVAGYHEHLARRRDIAQRRYLSDERLLVHIRAFDAEIGELMAGDVIPILVEFRLRAVILFRN